MSRDILIANCPELNVAEGSAKKGRSKLLDIRRAGRDIGEATGRVRRPGPVVSALGNLSPFTMM